MEKLFEAGLAKKSEYDSLKELFTLCFEDSIEAVNAFFEKTVSPERIVAIFFFFLAISSLYLLESDILSGVRAVTADNIEFNSLKERKIIIPPIELQNQFAAFVEQVDKSKFEIQQSLEKLEILKKSLMQKYFGWGERNV